MSDKVFRIERGRVSFLPIMRLGPAGATGPAGAPGATGAAGAIGPTGKSAYQLAVESGYAGTLSQWNTANTNAVNSVSVATAASNAAASSASAADADADQAAASLAGIESAIAGLPEGTLPVLVATRVLMAAIGSPTAGDAVILLEAGREGLFVFSAANVSGSVTSDTRQGIFVAPSSATSGASGAWVRKYDGARSVRWFGTTADFVTDDLPAFEAACASLGISGGTVRVPAGRYYLSATLNLHNTVRLIGDGTDWNGAGSTIMRFGKNTNGIVINHANTHGDGLGTQGIATGSQIEGIALWGGNVNVNGAGAVTTYSAGDSISGHGIRVRTPGVRMRDVNCAFFGGDGFNIVSFAGSGGIAEGNANNFYLDNCQSIYNRRHGYFAQGTDANAGTFNTCSAISNGGGGFVDYSFLGNSYIQCHVRDCGKTDPVVSGGPVGCCTYGGNQYYVVQGQEVAASTTVPGTNANIWVLNNFIGATKAWVSGLTWVNGACYGTDLANVNARNVLMGCYAESSQIPVQTAAPSLMLGGLLDEVGLSPQTTATWLVARNGAAGAAGFVTRDPSSLNKYTSIGAVNGLFGHNTLLAHFDGTYTFQLYSDGGGLQFNGGGGAIFSTGALGGTKPNWFTPKQLMIASPSDINVARRHATIDAIANLAGLTLQTGEVLYFTAPVGYLGVTVVVGGTGGSTAALCYFGKIGYPLSDGNAARTASLADAGCFLRFTGAATLTIPPNATVAFPLGTEIDGIQAGAGALTIAAGAGVTLNSSGGDLVLAGQFSSFTAKKVGTNEWDVVGKF